MEAWNSELIVGDTDNRLKNVLGGKISKSAPNCPKMRDRQLPHISFFFNRYQKYHKVHPWECYSYTCATLLKLTTDSKTQPITYHILWYGKNTFISLWQFQVLILSFVEGTIGTWEVSHFPLKTKVKPPVWVDEPLVTVGGLVCTYGGLNNVPMSILLK